MRKGKRGFTIIELIVVMTIIMMLAGLVAAAAGTARQRALIARTRAMIAGIETGIGMFQSDLGGYPSDGANTDLYNCLMTSTSGSYEIGTRTLLVSTNTNWAGPYMTFKDNDLTGGNRVIDAWGTVFLYTNPDTSHGGSYVDIRSAGPDRTYGNTDDVTNWTR
ncbi:MAG: type II secretion system protein GspG [Candidatus Omnitrophica bacterium]|nr:type II secretion system protein GspG [Candidatus Omnitrophota bacterium]MDD5737363.1 type II secretion system protein GspG [Candidatus Omnitrophota bacterium]